MARSAPVKVASVDVDEAVSLTDNASGLLSIAEESFSDLKSIFEAIEAALPVGSLARRLADLGNRTAEIESSTFGGYKREYNDHTKRLLALSTPAKEVSHG